MLSQETNSVTPASTVARWQPIFGDPALLPAIHQVQIKGNLVRSRARYVRESYGEPTLRLLAEGLDEVARAYLMSPPLPGNWCDLGPLMALDRAIVERLMHGRVDGMRQLGREVASYDLSTLYKLFMRVGSPGFVLSRLGAAYRTYISRGELAIRVEAHTAEVELLNGVLPFYFCAEGIPGWITMAAEKSGATEVEVRQRSCRHHGARSCQWSVSWTQR